MGIIIKREVHIITGYCSVIPKTMLYMVAGSLYWMSKIQAYKLLIATTMVGGVSQIAFGG